MSNGNALFLSVGRCPYCRHFLQKSFAHTSPVTFPLLPGSISTPSRPLGSRVDEWNAISCSLVQSFGISSSPSRISKLVYPRFVKDLAGCPRSVATAAPPCHGQASDVAPPRGSGTRGPPPGRWLSPLAKSAATEGGYGWGALRVGGSVRMYG